jgi:endonuclease III
MIRICNRIPITREKSPTKIRKFLEHEFEKGMWGEINETLVGFG